MGRIRIILASALTLALSGCPGHPVYAGVPAACQPFQSVFVRTVRYVWGLEAPVAAIAGQMMQESGCKPHAVSHVGAMGLMQFMPQTAEWIPEIDAELYGWDTFNPPQAIRAGARYDLYLYRRASWAEGECHRLGAALAAYNGGEKWVQRDRKLAIEQGLNPRHYFGAGETVNAGRKASAKRENVDYPRRILFQRQHEFRAWGREADCDD